MLSKGAFPGSSLICCDCGTPVVTSRTVAETTKGLSGLLLGGMGGFVLLLAFLTGMRSVESEQPVSEVSIEKINGIQRSSTTRR